MIAIIAGDAFLIRISEKHIIRAQLRRMLTYMHFVGKEHLSKRVLKWAPSVCGHRRKEKPEPVKNRFTAFDIRQIRI